MIVMTINIYIITTTIHIIGRVAVVVVRIIHNLDQFQYITLFWSAFFHGVTVTLNNVQKVKNHNRGS